MIASEWSIWSGGYRGWSVGSGAFDTILLWCVDWAGEEVGVGLEHID